VVLLDEIEKASSYVRNLFLQVFDEGWLTDAKGKRVYFSDSIIIMTSNIGADRYKKLSKPMGFLKDGMDFSIIKEEVINDLENLFSPEFINRIDEVVIFSPLRESEVKEIARNYLLKIAKQMNKEGKKLIFSDKIIDFFAKEGYSIKYGARFLKRKIDELVKVPITLNWNKSRRFIIDVDENGLVLK
jgi:ATP-dependent Clp protease ATP-binding subunit ClpA